MKTILLFTISILVSITSFSQNVLEEGDSPNLSDLEQSIKNQGGGVYYKENNRNRVLRGINPETKKYETTYPHVREADVMWSTTIWREIDLREKMNQPLYYPVRISPEPQNADNPLGYHDESGLLKDRRSLIDVIMTSVLNGDPSRNLPPLPCYGNARVDDEFKQRMTMEELENLYASVDTNYFYDEEREQEDFAIDKTGFNRNEVTKYLIKEEWFFDKQRSVMDVRIIGICPMKEVYDDGEYMGEAKIFWLYFPEARPYLAGWEVFNHQNNNASRMTYDDLFMMRYFNSTIVKEANPYDREINKYKQGLDALLEAENIKNKIFNLEMDLWEY